MAEAASVLGIIGFALETGKLLYEMGETILSARNEISSVAKRRDTERQLEQHQSEMKDTLEKLAASLRVAEESVSKAHEAGLSARSAAERSSCPTGNEPDPNDDFLEGDVKASLESDSESESEGSPVRNPNPLLHQNTVKSCSNAISRNTAGPSGILYGVERAKEDNDNASDAFRALIKILPWTPLKRPHRISECPLSASEPVKNADTIRKLLDVNTLDGSYPVEEFLCAYETEQLR
ncbi:MAG: hypothetical protein Q9162_001416 [Coniocarpon cinnabarinum]